MFCPYCGKEIPDTANICGYCGKPQPKKEAAPPPEAVKEVKPAPAPESPPPAKMEKAPKAPKPEKAKPTGPGLAERVKNLPRWAQIGVPLLIVAALVAGFLILSPGSQEIHLLRFCSTRPTANAGQPITLVYGYWGVTEEYLSANENHLSFNIRLNNENLKGRRASAIPTQDLPCITRSGVSSSTMWTDGVWIYDTLNIGKLEPGNYVITVNGFLDERQTDGFMAADRTLTYYGPGQIIGETFTLIVK